MKISTIFLFLSGPILLTGCSSGVEVLMQTERAPEPVPLYHVVVSSHPPRGTYNVIAEMSVESDPGENVIHFKRRLQEEGAALGADYVFIVGGRDNNYIAPAVGNAITTGNASATAYPNADGSVTASGYGTADTSSFYMPAHQYVRTEVVAKALRMTSGINQPDMSQPSTLIK